MYTERHLSNFCRARGSGTMECQGHLKGCLLRYATYTVFGAAVYPFRRSQHQRSPMDERCARPLHLWAAGTAADLKRFERCPSASLTLAYIQWRYKEDSPLTKRRARRLPSSVGSPGAGAKVGNTMAVPSSRICFTRLSFRGRSSS